uniref:Proton-coupled zinc antiporter SLC30A9, mitochondrial n=3 Tax=Mesocestoides corti TaxID=53468 RepID=A0A5K3F5J4_MESCO
MCKCVRSCFTLYNSAAIKRTILNHHFQGLDKVGALPQGLQFILSRSASSHAGSDNVETEVIPKIKTPLKYDDSVKSVKYLTPLRALNEYVLSPADLEKLPRYYSRSPYSNEVRTQVFLRSDVERIALEKHGGQEALEMRRKLVKEMERKASIDKFTYKKLAKEIKLACNRDRNKEKPIVSTSGNWRVGPGRVVMFAIGVNSLNMAAKAVAWWFTGSKSMFSEMMHSVADTLNQILLAYGLRFSLQRPDVDHPYGYQRMQSISSLISGVGIFFLGSGFTFYHAVQGLIVPHGLDETSVYGAIAVTIGSLLSEGSTLLMAYREVKAKAAESKFDSIRAYLESGTANPSTSVVLLEDTAAVLGVLVATGALSASIWTGATWPDTVGGIAISGILAAVAAFIIRTNTDILLGKSISLERQEKIMRFIDNVKIIRGTYDTKAMLMGGGDSVRLKVEVDVDGRELTRRYLETMQLDVLLAEINTIKTEEQMVHFMLKHGDQIVNTLGAEINQIEEGLKKEFPDIKHIDIEIN